MGIYILAGLALAIAAAWSVLLWRATRALRAQAALEERVTRLTEALALLTDTTETGFRALSDQIAALEIAPAKTSRKPAAAAPRPTTTGRVVRAARRGRSASEIAASEDVSEGEVRLRLHLAEAAKRAAAHEVKNGTLRAR